ncbi:hypothetical protein [Rhodococcus opacus]|uniref:hypothetical protein n=1 Tax=Rhodococcus opacus TaxID=37919 RepID=UPI001F44FEA8|nr:hypothetical protein [Rhodococcus opacus]
MAVFAPLWMLVGDGAGGEVHAVLMATSMTAGMAAWMLWRRHGWRAIAEMGSAMYPVFVVLVPLPWLGLLSDEGLMIAGHVLILPVMAITVVNRREEYLGAPDLRPPTGRGRTEPQRPTPREHGDRHDRYHHPTPATLHRARAPGWPGGRVRSFGRGRGRDQRRCCSPAPTAPRSRSRCGHRRRLLSGGGTGPSLGGVGRRPATTVVNPRRRDARLHNFAQVRNVRVVHGGHPNFTCSIDVGQ